MAGATFADPDLPHRVASCRWAQAWGRRVLRLGSSHSQRAVAPPWQASASWLMFAAAEAGTMGRVEIRLVLDAVEPSVGRLRVVRDSGQAYRPCGDQELGFTGWLGLLRALYEVTAERGARSSPGP